jgi:hypothetical protein
VVEPLEVDQFHVLSFAGNAANLGGETGSGEQQPLCVRGSLGLELILDTVEAVEFGQTYRLDTGLAFADCADPLYVVAVGCNRDDIEL